MFDVFFIMMRMALEIKGRWDDDTQKLMMKILVVLFGDMKAGKRGLYIRDCPIISLVVKKVAPNGASGYNPYNRMFGTLLAKNSDIYAIMSTEAEGYALVDFIKDFYSPEQIPEVCLKTLEYTRGERDNGKIKLEVAVSRLNRLFDILNVPGYKYSEVQALRIKFITEYRKRLSNDLECHRKGEEERLQRQFQGVDSDLDDWIGDDSDDWIGRDY